MCRSSAPSKTPSTISVLPTSTASSTVPPRAPHGATAHRARSPQTPTTGGRGRRSGGLGSSRLSISRALGNRAATIARAGPVMRPTGSNVASSTTAAYSSFASGVPPISRAIEATSTLASRSPARARSAASVSARNRHGASARSSGRERPLREEQREAVRRTHRRAGDDAHAERRLAARHPAHQEQLLRVLLPEEGVARADHREEPVHDLQHAGEMPGRAAPSYMSPTAPGIRPRQITTPSG